MNGPSADRTAFIGLGTMGAPMAANLLRRGIALTVFDVVASHMEAAVRAGAQGAASPADAAGRAARSIVMVETTAQVEAVIFGQDGILAGASPGHAIAVMSTIDHAALKSFHERARAVGVHLIDAPVSGAQPRAVTAELTVFCGGDAQTLDTFRPAFEAMGNNIFHIGPIGQGLALKLINNMLMQVNAVTMAEGLALGVKAGLDLQTMNDAIRVSSGMSFAFDLRMPRIMKRDFAPGGTFDISYKDQELVTAMAKQLQQPLLMANLSQQVYQIGRAAGLNKLDGSALIKVYELLGGNPVEESE